MYEKHCANLKQIEYSIVELEKSIKYAIKTDNQLAITTYTNIHSFLTGAWIEVSLYKLIHEKQYHEEDRTFILEANSLEGKWINTLNLAFSKVSKNAFDKIDITTENVRSVLQRSQQYYFCDLHNFISNDLKTVIEIRNKIAHGQWEYAFNHPVDNINQLMQKEIKTNHYFKSKLRLETMKVIIKMTHNISVSPRTFKRDFDEHYNVINQIKFRYNDENYLRNIETMREKYNRAEYWKNKNKSNIQ